MLLTGVRNEKNELVAIDIDFNCRNCGDPVRMRYNVILKGIKKQLFLDQARQELCVCDFNSSYKCVQSGVEKLFKIIEDK